MFPIAAITVIALLTILFLLFYYVYAFNLTETAADHAAHAVGGDRVYWQLTGEPVDPEQKQKIAENLKDRLTAAAVIPGLSFSSSLSENAAKTRITASAACQYGGKTLFSVKSVRPLLKPTEFAQNIDLLSDVMDETGITKAIEEKFGAYLEKDKTYEIF